MYVAGFDSTPGFDNFAWRMEKRRLDTGALDMAFGPKKNGVVTVDVTEYWEVIRAIAVDQNSIYIAGYESFDIVNGKSDSKWRMEKIDKKTGNRILGFGDNIDANFMYVIGFDRGPQNGASTGEWRIEKRSLQDGKLDPGFGIAGVVKSDPSDQEDIANSIAIDNEFMYVAGWDISQVDFFSEWRIEKRSLADGVLDQNFGNGGVRRYNSSRFHDSANAIVLYDNCFRAAGYDSGGNADPKIADMQWRILGGLK